MYEPLSSEAGKSNSIIVHEVLITPVAAVRPKVTRWSTYYPGEYGRYLPKLRGMLQQGWLAPPKSGLVELDVEFWLPRPKSHYGTGRNAGKVKKSAPVVPHQDVDNLLKGAMDAASGVLYEDDKQVVGVSAKKAYGDARIVFRLWDGVRV